MKPNYDEKTFSKNLIKKKSFYKRLYVEKIEFSKKIENKAKTYGRVTKELTRIFHLSSAVMNF